jgi:hypothetical protein
MENTTQLAVYKLNVDLNRQGELKGLFIAKKNHVRLLLENKIQVYFGEVLGKHSEVYGSLEENDIIFVSDNEDVIDLILEHDLEHGFNPFEYTAINTDRDDFEDETILNVVEILEQEENEKSK